MKISRKDLEKILLLVGASVLVLFGLFWNLYSDLAVSMSADSLFIGLITSIVGGVLVYVGSVINTFDVKIKGLVFEGVGALLGIGNIVYLLIGTTMEIYSIITIVGVGLGLISIIVAIVFQFLRFKDNED